MSGLSINFNSVEGVVRVYKLQKNQDVMLMYQKRQGSRGNGGIMRFVFTNFQADNYGTFSGDSEGTGVYN